ncbi:transporter [Chromatiales bacterium (ex Bugula neritina AB1)]|nr:transporter [Chromatiales bacterium (ex Bugula neritina AB1)]
MAIQPPLQELPIATTDSGFYANFNQIVSLASKIAIALVVIWAAVFPESAGKTLGAMKTWSFNNLNHYYTWSVGFFIIVCLIIALHPRWGKTILGDGGKPEFSNFSWFSMMFGAGIGIGMLGYATGEPMWHIGDNPLIRMSTIEVKAALDAAGIAIAEGSTAMATYTAQVEAGNLKAIPDLVLAKTESAITSTYRYSFLHWGLGAWACYALVGISLSFFAYSRGLPLTIRSTLAPLFGRSLSGPIGHFVDITAVVATILGISQTIGLGLDSFSAGLYNFTGAEWLMTTDDKGVLVPSTGSMLLALAVVMVCSTLSALSGVGKGIKWLSNLNMVLSFSLLAFFAIFGSTLFALKILGFGILDYIIHLPAITFQVFPAEGAGSPGEWQGWWSIFYWAWWIAFAPFVGIFLARISKNRSIREFVLGSIVAPSFMCFLWFALLGGTAIDLELNGSANGSIFAKSLTAQLYETINVMMPEAAAILSILIVILLLTYLVTSADSAVLVVNTISAGGSQGAATKHHIIMWGLILTAVIAALLLAGGLNAIQSAMIIGAIPFSFFMILMGVSLIKALIRDDMRNNQKQS